MDHWNFNDCDKRFGEDWAGRIPAQLVAHTLFYFTKPGDLVLDPPYFNPKKEILISSAVSFQAGKKKLKGLSSSDIGIFRFGMPQFFPLVEHHPENRISLARKG